MKLITKTLFTTLLLFFITTGIRAQEKYDFAILSYSQYWQNITISMSGTKYTVVDAQESSKINTRNFNTVLNEVSKLQDQGWELFNTQATGMTSDAAIGANYPNYLFYMRKKKG